MAEEVGNTRGTGENAPPGTLSADLNEMAIAFNQLTKEFIRALTPIAIAAGKALNELWIALNKGHDEDPTGFHGMLGGQNCPVCELRSHAKVQ